MKYLRPAIVMTVVLIVLTGIAYPLVVMGIGSVLFSSKAGGSLIERNGAVVGSSIIGQGFKSERYFQGRPSAAGNGYDASSSGGSNLAPTNKALIDAVAQRIKALTQTNQGTKASRVPIDLVTASGSGLDPEISPAAAEFQVKRVAKARGLSEDQVRNLVAANTTARSAGIFGEPRVNVLLLNLALDDEAGANQHASSNR
jgi:K+-transporting ATPase ATPase C chain